MAKKAPLPLLPPDFGWTTVSVVCAACGDADIEVRLLELPCEFTCPMCGGPVEERALQTSTNLV